MSSYCSKVQLILLTSIICLVSYKAYALGCSTKRIPFFNRQYAKAWKTTICPNSKLKFHKHHTARILIPYESGMLKVLYKSGKSEMIKLTKGIPMYLPVSEGLKLHEDINVGKKPLSLIVISIKR